MTRTVAEFPILGKIGIFDTSENFRMTPIIKKAGKSGMIDVIDIFFL